VSQQTVARYCRELLDSAKPKKSRRPKMPPTEPAASAQEELPVRSPVGHTWLVHQTEARAFQLKGISAKVLKLNF
jgi:hypothetical protein